MNIIMYLNEVSFAWIQTFAFSPSFSHASRCVLIFWVPIQLSVNFHVIKSANHKWIYPTQRSNRDDIISCTAWRASFRGFWSLRSLDLILGSSSPQTRDLTRHSSGVVFIIGKWICPSKRGHPSCSIQQRDVNAGVTAFLRAPLKKTLNYLSRKPSAAAWCQRPSQLVLQGNSRRSSSSRNKEGK